jgi:succinate dehydrogenase hydrophobic anchor subunit
MNLIEKKAREVYFAVYDEATALGVSEATSKVLARVASAEIYHKWNGVKRVLTKWLRRCVVAVAVAVAVGTASFLVAYSILNLLPQ